MGMKIDLCGYSGYKIYPARGRTLVKQDGKVYKFLDGRTMKAHLLKRNPRKVTWTVLYRRKHKKGIEEEAAKAQREQAIRAAKEVKKTTKATTKKAPAAGGVKAPKPKAAAKAQKTNMKAAPKVGGKR